VISADLPITQSVDMVDTYLCEIEAAVRKIDRGDVRAVVDTLFACWQRGGTTFVIGNGGSAATASHMMNDLIKCTIVEGQPRFRAIALTDNVASLTAFANDVAYEEIFVEQLCALLRAGDVLVALSGSGNSPNVLRAVGYAKEAGAKTVGLCGDTGGKLALLADVAVKIPAARIGQQEDGHLILNHAIALTLHERIAAARDMRLQQAQV
jgi:D-sedoheptulose 7-phosphate isomerase